MTLVEFACLIILPFHEFLSQIIQTFDIFCPYGLLPVGGWASSIGGGETQQLFETRTLAADFGRGGVVGLRRYPPLSKTC